LLALFVVGGVSVRFVTAAISLLALTSNHPASQPLPFGTGPFAASARPVSLRPESVIRFVSVDALPDANALALNAERAFDRAPVASAPFRFARTGIDRERAERCLAAAAWYEAGDDPGGERAVIQVVLNRVRHSAYPGSVCAVVFQGSDLPTGCQFTFSCDGALARRPGADAWKRALSLAQAALDGAVDAEVGGATHYHADYVYPWWAPSLQKLARVGAHVFYQFPNSTQFARAPQHVDTAPELDIAKLAMVTDMRGMPSPADALQPAVLLASSPLDPALVAGIRTDTQPQPKPDGAIRFTVDLQQPSGRWALKALASCTGKRDCRVVGTRPAPVDTLGAAADLQRPLFVFVRDSTAHSEFALWDCAAAPRTDKGECLPQSDAAIARLLKQKAAPAARALVVAAPSPPPFPGN
jgi:spore germination cell wall hydrolase CwlJ-like protein